MQLKIEIDKKSIGRRLKTARESFGLTQEKLSEEMGCTSKYISKVEKRSFGSHHFRSLSNFPRLLGVI